MHLSAFKSICNAKVVFIKTTKNIILNMNFARQNQKNYNSQKKKKTKFEKRNITIWINNMSLFVFPSYKPNIKVSYTIK